MKQLVQDIYNNPKNERFFSWVKLIAVTGGAQISVQIIGLISGILIIRLLPTHEYGLYTLANTMLGTMVVLSDGGICTGLMAQGGKVWNDKARLGIVLATGLDLRRKFAIGSLLVSMPIMVYLLKNHDVSWGTTLMIVASLIPAFYSALSDSLLEVIPKLNQSVLPLQKNQLAVSFGRLFLSGLSLLIFPLAFVAILASGIPRFYGNIRLRIIAYRFADKNQQPDALIRKEILVMVKRILPGAIYYCIYGQITIWIISLFGNTASVAKLGALGRLGMLLSLFNVLIATLIIPRFARLPAKKEILFRRIIQILGMLFFSFFLIILFTYFFPNQILWILGSAYTDLHLELMLSILGSCLSIVSGVAFSLYTSRGWVMNPFILILGSVFSIAAGIYFFDVSTLVGVLYFNLLPASFAVIFNCGFLFFKVFTHDKKISAL